MARPIVACILSRDESALLRENVAHLIYHEHIEHIIITNHVSIAANREATKPFAPYICKQFDHPDPLPFPQDAWRTDMYQWAVKHLKASWVVCADTDEFWYGLQGLKNVRRPYNSVSVLKYYEHYGTRIDETKPYSIYNMPWHKLSKRRSRTGKTIHRGRSAKICIKGCSHRPIQRGGVLLDPSWLCLHHYYVRDWERFLLKVNTADEKNVRGQRRTNWRKIQEAGRLKQYWQNTFMPPVVSLQAQQAEGKIGYFMPPPLPEVIQ